MHKLIENKCYWEKTAFKKILIGMAHTHTHTHTHTHIIAKMSFLSQIQPMNTNVEHYLEQDTNPAEEAREVPVSKCDKKLTKLSLQKYKRASQNRY